MGFKKFLVILMILLFITFVCVVLWLMYLGMAEPVALIQSVTVFLTGELSLTALLAIFEKKDKKKGLTNEQIINAIADAIERNRQQNNQ